MWMTGISKNQESPFRFLVPNHFLHSDYSLDQRLISHLDLLYSDLLFLIEIKTQHISFREMKIFQIVG